MDVDEKNQVMSILAYIDFHWTDYKLRWDPANFGGIEDVRFAGDSDAPFKLWRPDVLLFNSVSESFDSTYSSRFIVNYDGEVQQNPPGIFRFICKVDVTYYPFDTQTCFLKLGSWTYSGNYIDLDFMLKDIVGIRGHRVKASIHPIGDNEQSYFVNESIDLQVYLQNGEWDLMNTPGKRVVTFFGFTLPPDACEKVTLETTILLSVIFFLQMVSNMSPPQSKSVPILAAFFSCCLMVVSCSCVFTVLVLSLHHRKPETHEMSPFMRRILVVWLPNVLFMRRPDHPRAPKPKVIHQSILPIQRLSTFMPMLNLPRPSQTAVPLLEQGNSIIQPTPPPPHLKYFKQCCNTLSVINKDLEKITDKVDDTYKQEMIVSEWRFAAMAVDRMCLYLFSLFITISTCGIIMPHILTGLQEQL